MSVKSTAAKTRTRSSRLAPMVALGSLVLVAFALSVLADATPKTTSPTAKKSVSKPGKSAIGTSKRNIDPSKITWLNYSDGVKFARAEKKHVIVDFTASWCGWCKRMDAETFSDTAVINYINANFIPVKVWSDSEEKLDLDGYLVPQSAISSEMFKVQGLPTFHFLSPSKTSDSITVIRGFSGYRPKEEMMKVLDIVKNEKYKPSKPTPPTETPSDGKG